MAKKNLTNKSKTDGTFLRLTPDFKKRVKIYAIKNNKTMTDVFVEAVEEKIKS